MGNTDKVQKIKKEISTWVLLIFLTFTVSYFTSSFILNTVILNAYVPTGSMENVIEVGDRIIANRIAYTLSDPQRFDIVVFNSPDNGEQLFVKRIIGLPGETVTIRNGRVYIDDDNYPLEDYFIKEHSADNFGPFKVPEDGYFMLGDNRNQSKDSRHWYNQYVNINEIVGRVVLRYYPNISIDF